ncbi:MAG: ABC transporter ATP-binding protein, partial [Pseudomonadota bacterium]
MSETVLRIEGLSKAFGALRATQDVSLSLEPGEIHAIIGPNGAGKSTLIKQICGNLASDRGQVWLGGQEVSGWSTQARAQAGLARTFQISELAMEDSVLENAVLGAIGALGRAQGIWRPALGMIALRQRAEAALARVGLASEAERRCADLSHGQRRQLEVALALTLAPRAFVMDEPMAGLGAEGSRVMTDFLGSLRQEAPILLVEHDMDAVFALADRISVLVSGRIVASGTGADRVGPYRSLRAGAPA